MYLKLTKKAFKSKCQVFTAYETQATIAAGYITCTRYVPMGGTSSTDTEVTYPPALNNVLEITMVTAHPIMQPTVASHNTEAESHDSTPLHLTQPKAEQPRLLKECPHRRKYKNTDSECGHNSS